VSGLEVQNGYLSLLSLSRLCLGLYRRPCALDGAEADIGQEDGF